MDVIAVKALVSHLHPGTQSANGGQFFHHEANCLCCGRKATVLERLTRARLAFGHEQFGCRRVVERHDHWPLTESPVLADAIKLAFLGHSLMRLSGALDSVLKLVAFRWQKLRDLIDAAADTKRS